jgi:hypothetical protein
MVETKHSGKSMEQRIRDKLNPSCSPDADVRTSQGSGPTRVHTAVHFSGSAKQHGSDAKGVDIHGHPRGPANRDGEIK